MPIVKSNSWIKWIMLVSGALTCTMVYAALAPHESVQSNFGETFDGAAIEIVVRNWGALIALVGAMLIYGAFEPVVRPLVLTVAGISKIVFISLVLSYGTRYLSQQVGIAVAVDSLMVVLYAACLVAGRRAVATA